MQLGLCNEITHHGLISFHQIDKLTKLTLWRSNVDDDGLDILLSIKSLTYLDIEGCNKITGECMGSSVSTSLLDYLDVSNCENLTNDGLIRLGGLNKLCELNISRCININDVGIQGLTEHSKTLTIIHMTMCGEITNKSLICFKKLNVKELHIDWCSNINDDGLMSLAPIKCLEEIHIEGTSITQEGVDSFRQWREENSFCLCIIDNGLY